MTKEKNQDQIQAPKGQSKSQGKELTEKELEKASGGGGEIVITKVLDKTSPL